MPEDIIINISEGAEVPKPLPGHKWKQVIHNQYVSWLAGWKDSINTRDWKCVHHFEVKACGQSSVCGLKRHCRCAHRYVQLGATSSLKGESDLNKYEKVSCCSVLWRLFPC